MAKIVTCWIRREQDDDSRAQQISVASETTISGLQSTIVASKIFPVTFNSDITKITLDGKELSNRTRLSSLNVTDESTFVITCAAHVPGTNGLSDIDDLLAAADKTTNGEKEDKEKDKEADKKDDENGKDKDKEKSDKDKEKDEKAKKSFLVTDEEDPDNPNKRRRTLKIVAEELREVVCSELGSYISQLYETEPSVVPHQLLVFLKQLVQRAEHLDDKEHPLHSLIEWLNQEYSKQTKALESMVSEGVITFEGLWFLFPKGTKICVIEPASNCKVGSEVVSYNYRITAFASFFVVKGTVVQSTGSRYTTKEKSFSIPFYSGAKKIKDLQIKKLDDATMAELSERGKLFAEYGTGVHFLAYTGNLYRRSWYNISYFNGDGRLMVDGCSFARMNPNYDHEDYTGDSRIFTNSLNSSSSESTDINPVNYYKTWPTVLGFSFISKKWGEFMLTGLKPIQFDEHAFSRLVLPDDRKELIKALIQNQKATFTDVITGKGGGCIILLHGQPGVGKTLTAEAIAELLHRPLYSVSVGELGTDTQELEKNLRQILEVASVWNAVILLDEADIFLEKRTTNGIIRNAMVGIFLRLLEYHQGVLFLTTNKVKSFDTAFHSRISIALHYDALDSGAKLQIWENFLTLAKEFKTNADKNNDNGNSSSNNKPSVEMPDKAQMLELAKHDLNGRQIKTIVRISQSLSTAKSEPLSLKHINTTIDLFAKFNKDVGGEKHSLELGKEQDQDQEESTTNY